jgi:hypothetical protein
MMETTFGWVICRMTRGKEKPISVVYYNGEIGFSGYVYIYSARKQAEGDMKQLNRERGIFSVKKVQIFDALEFQKKVH